MACQGRARQVFLMETAAYGAEVVTVDGLITDAGKVCAARAKESGWYECATLKEPYRVEGKKTMGYELAEQMGWQLPDAILYPTGGGTGLIGMWKAFDELEDRKSTRLNSSHSQISYAVFCLKKKKN